MRIQDLRQGLRELRQSPGFTVVGVLILAFGIGLNLAFYQVATVTLLRPPPIRSPETLVRFDRRAPTFHSNGVPVRRCGFRTPRDTTCCRRSSSSLGSSVVWGEDAVEVDAQFVSANWFERNRVWAVPRAGAQRDGRRPCRRLAGGRDQPRVLDERPREGSRRRLAESVTIDRRPAVIIGVAPAGFSGV